MAGKVECTCAMCGKVFPRYPGNMKAGNQLCSKACTKEFRARTKVSRVCVKCGEQFLVSPSKVTNGRGIYCSPECKGTSQDVSCSTCGKGFRLATNAVNPKGNFCSRECHYKSHGRTPYSNDDGSISIPLTQGYIAIVDEQDLAVLEGISWCAFPHRKTVYAKGQVGDRMMTMHQFLMKPEKGMVTDHIDRDGLNNRRTNLRVCTDTENKMNRGPDRDNKLGVKGVRRQGSRFMARIQNSTIGYFDTAEEAAQAYDAEAKRRFGEFAYQNIQEKEAA